MDEYAGFTEFVAARSAALSRLAYLLTGDHGTAEDLLQDALTKAAMRWRRIDLPEAFIRRTMYHQAVSGWRRRRRIREQPVAEPDDAGGPDGSDDTVRRIVLEHALARLTPRQRAVLVLRFYEDRTAVEAADLLGCSVGTVKSQTSHALERLRRVAPELVDLTWEMA
jgi:RNA polymerase sigma-70 factor (sigma-E family)